MILQKNIKWWNDQLLILNNFHYNNIFVRQSEVCLFLNLRLKSWNTHSHTHTHTYTIQTSHPQDLIWPPRTILINWTADLAATRKLETINCNPVFLTIYLNKHLESMLHRSKIHYSFRFGYSHCHLWAQIQTKNDIEQLALLGWWRKFDFVYILGRKLKNKQSWKHRDHRTFELLNYWRS